MTEPKSEKGRDIPLGDDAIAALEAERHLRAPLVFCEAAGRMWKKNEVRRTEEFVELNGIEPSAS